MNFEDEIDIDHQIELEHLLFLERRCRVCGNLKDLIQDYYLTRRGKGVFPSSYSYECKECTKKRTILNRKNSFKQTEWQYPDW